MSGSAIQNLSRASVLTLVGKENLATGFTLEGGTTNKILTVTGDATISETPPVHADLDVLMDNIVILGWQLAIHSGLTVYNLEDGVVDEFEDESGVDTTDSLNETYDSSGDYYWNPQASQYPPAHSDTYVKATSKYDTTAWPYFATDPAKSVIGSNANNGWCSVSGTVQNRFHIDLGSAKVITRIYYENNHASGGNTDEGIKNFTFWGSNTAAAFADTTYGTDTNWTQLATSPTAMVQHSASNVADPHYITVTNTTAYRYYAFKFADNWGSANYQSIRRIELQTAIPDMTLISESKEANSQPTKARFLTLVEPVDTITLNTDLLAYISEDDQAHWDQVTLADEGYFDATKKIYAGNVNLTSYSDKTMRQKLVTANNKNLKVHAWAMLWGV